MQLIVNWFISILMLFALTHCGQKDLHHEKLQRQLTPTTPAQEGLNPSAGTEEVVFEFNPDAKNSTSAMNSPYVLLVSLDGFRYDYAKKYQAKHLLNMAANGVSTQGLIPCYPSKTFPNHYSIITGVYPDEHGIVSNSFIDPSFDKKDNLYKIGGATSNDEKWYRGEPLWVTAQRNQGLSASFFWVGSEAANHGSRPNWYVKFDETVSSDRRINRVFDWLALPVERRPHFVTLYFSDVDHEGHSFGPDSKEVAAAVLKVDAIIGKIQERIKQSGLPINLVVVSDHGMEQLDPAKTIVVGDKIDKAAFETSETGPLMKLYLKPGAAPEKIDSTIEALKSLGAPMRVWKRTEMTELHYSLDPRAGDIVLEPDAPYNLVLTAPTKKDTLNGNHGWDPMKFENMHGIFYAEGPAFKKGLELPKFRNVDIYPLLAKVLKYETLPKISGNLKITGAALSESENVEMATAVGY